MAKKSMKDAAAAGTSVFDVLASGNATDTKDAENAQSAKDAKDVKDVQNNLGRPLKYDIELTRLNLRVPASIKEYLAVAAAKESIKQRRQISLTEYLIELVKKDAAEHGE